MKLRHFVVLLGTAATVAVVVWILPSDPSGSRAADLRDASEVVSQPSGLGGDSRESEDAASRSVDDPQTRTRIATEPEVGKISSTDQRALPLPKIVRETILRILNVGIATSEKQHRDLLRDWKGGIPRGLDALKKEAEISYDIEGARSALRALRAGHYLVSPSNEDTSGFVDADHASKKYMGLFAIDGKFYDLTSSGNLERIRVRQQTCGEWKR